MNDGSTLIYIIIGLVILVGIGYWIFVSGKKTDDTKSQPRHKKSDDSVKKPTRSPRSPEKKEPAKRTAASREPKKSSEKKSDQKKSEPSSASTKKKPESSSDALKDEGAADPKKADDKQKPKTEAPKKGKSSSDVVETGEDDESHVEPEKKKDSVAPQEIDAEATQRAREEARKALEKGLKGTRGGFIAKLGSLLRGKKEVDPELIENIEEILLTADVGVLFTERLVSAMKENLSGKELKDPDLVWTFIKELSQTILSPSAEKFDIEREKPFVIMVIGVNGVGKTTTIAKLASNYVKDGKKVILAAGDTFRAAAVRQLEMWGKRVGAEVVKNDKQGADPSSVVFDAIETGIKNGADVIIADTAGRLHTKAPLMEELKKVSRVMGKALEGSPHEVLLVLDSNTGQNAIHQVREFKEALEVTGIILTKLDGTAKGGVIMGICEEHKIPVRFIGVGERDDDLREFNAEDFVTVLFERPDEAGDTAA